MSLADSRRRWANAAALLIGLTACAPARPPAYVHALSEARRAQTAGRFGEAARRFDEAAETAGSGRDAAFARYEAALARAQAGDVARAAKDLRAIADTQPPNEYSAQALYKAADLAAKSDPGRGQRELEAMAIRFPESGVARSALMRVIRDDDARGDAAATLAHLEHLAPRFEGTSLAQTIAYERAKHLRQLGRAQLAHDAFLAVASRWPYPFGVYFDDALYAAGEIDDALGRPQEAVTHLEFLLQHRETSDTIGTYERPKYVPSMKLLAKIYETRLHDRAAARRTYHRLYTDFTTSPERDNALWDEARLWFEDNDAKAACARLGTLVHEFPDSVYVPCAVARCPDVQRPGTSRAPQACRRYILEPQGESSDE